MYAEVWKRMGSFQLPGLSLTEDPQTYPSPPGPRAMKGLTLGAPLLAGSGPWTAQTGLSLGWSAPVQHVQKKTRDLQGTSDLQDPMGNQRI